MHLLRKIQYNAPVTLTFAVVSLLVLALGVITGGRTTALLFCVYRSPLSDPLTYVRLFGHVLGHADLNHYFSNMLLFLLLGPIVEEKYGSKMLLVMFAITAVVTGVINMALFTSGLLGASGLVFMLILLSSSVSADEGKIPLSLLLVIVLYLGQEVYAGVFTRDNTSQLTHIIGGLCGCGFGALWHRRAR